MGECGRVRNMAGVSSPLEQMARQPQVCHARAMRLRNEYSQLDFGFINCNLIRIEVVTEFEL